MYCIGGGMYPTACCWAKPLVTDSWPAARYCSCMRHTIRRLALEQATFVKQFYTRHTGAACFSLRLIILEAKADHFRGILHDGMVVKPTTIVFLQ